MPIRPPSSLPLRAALKSKTSSSSRTTASAQSQQIIRQSRQQPASQTKPFSSSTVAQGGGAHYDPPSGWLFGEPPGTKKAREAWEVPMYIFLAANALLTIGYIFKPDTSIQTWALEEARRRLEAEGILEDPDNKKDDE